jgi:hypothetical protein
MRFGKALDCAAMRALSLRSRNVHREYSAQFTRGCISVKVVHGCTHFRSPSPEQVAIHRGTAGLGRLQGFGGFSCRREPALAFSNERPRHVDHLKSATPSHTNCTAIARIKNPKMRLMAPVAHGPSRSTSGPPRRRNRYTASPIAVIAITIPR